MSARARSRLGTSPRSKSRISTRIFPLLEGSAMIRAPGGPHLHPTVGRPRFRSWRLPGCHRAPSGCAMSAVSIPGARPAATTRKRFPREGFRHDWGIRLRKTRSILASVGSRRRMVECCAPHSSPDHPTDEGLSVGAPAKRRMGHPHRSEIEGAPFAYQGCYSPVESSACTLRSL